MSTRLTTTLFALVIAAHYAPASAQNYGQGPNYGQGRPNTFDANCEVRKDGDTRKGETGPCTVTNRQGYITLDLKNGDVFSLTPSDQQNHFKDQKGNKVVRTQSGNGFQEFKWEGGKHVTVTFPENYRQEQYGWQQNNGGRPYGNDRDADDRYAADQRNTNRIGETPQGLAPLIGTQADEHDLKRLGYDWVQGSDNGPGRHALWYNANNQHCVRVRIENNHYQSITETDPRECTNPQSYRVGETPQGLAPLIGTRADENDLKRQGYNWVQGSDAGPGRHALWYNASNHHCVRVRVEGDRYQSITEANPNECTKR
jgi:hypothetical protein